MVQQSCHFCDSIQVCGLKWFKWLKRCSKYYGGVISLHLTSQKCRILSGLHSLWPTLDLAYILSGLSYIGPTLDLAFIILGHTFHWAYIILGIHYIWPTFSLAYIILGHTFHWAYIILGIYYIWPTFLLASLSISSPSFSLSSPKFLVPTLCYVIQFFEFSHLWSWEDFLQTQSVNKRTLSKTNFYILYYVTIISTGPGISFG